MLGVWLLGAAECAWIRRGVSCGVRGGAGWGRVGGVGGRFHLFGCPVTQIISNLLPAFRLNLLRREFQEELL